MTCACSLDYFNRILGDFNCGCLKQNNSKMTTWLSVTDNFAECDPENDSASMREFMWTTKLTFWTRWTYVGKKYDGKTGRYTPVCMNKTIIYLYSFR